MSNNRYDFLMSQIQYLRDIKESEKIKISLVFYEGRQSPCILKVCKDRDLRDVCRALMEVQHPNIAVIYDFAYANNNTYIVEEFVTGKTIQELLEEKGTFSAKETAKIMVEVCKGLEVLHKHKPSIIHNDIKTSNIMIREDGSVKLFDFDISRIYKKGADKNTRLFGTEEYASPEHYGFGQSEPCSDIYSLGVTMHEMLTGKGLTNEHKMAYRGKLAHIIRRCIEVDRKKRYSSAKQLKRELKKYLNKKRYIIPISIIIILLILFFGGITLFADKIQSYLDGVDESSSIKSTEEPISDGLEAEKPEDKAVQSENNKDEFETESSERGENDSNTTADEKKMEVVYSIEGELHSIITKTNGIYVILEKISGKYYIKSSDGTENVLNGIEGRSGAKLAYNRYSDSLYLLEHTGEELKVYTVNSRYEIANVANIKHHYSWDTTRFPCNFFSDGTMMCDPINKLVDSRSWTVIMDTSGGYVINDKIYKRLDDIFLGEVNEQGRIIAEYTDESFHSEAIEEQLYADGRYIYFIGSKENREYLYRFNGQIYEQVVCLNDYKNYSKFTYDFLNVTDEVIRCYDRGSHSIKEFRLK